MNEKSEELDVGRKFIYHTGKLGAIEGIEAFKRYYGKSEEDIQKFIEEAKKTLKEGVYRFDSSSLSLYEYLGNYEKIK